MFLTARQFCEGALRMVGAFAVNDAAARPQDMAVALELLDDLIGEISGVMDCFWLRTATLPIALEADTASYDLKTKLGADWPAQGIEYITGAWLESGSGDRGEIEICARAKIEAQSPQDQSGPPSLIYIDRLVPAPGLRVWPVPADTTWTLQVVAQTLAPTVRGVGPTPRANAGESISTGVPSSWNRYIKFALAADCGEGPVRTLPAQKTAQWRAIAERSRVDLLAFQNREHDTTAPITASMDVLCDTSSLGPETERW